MRAAVIRGLSAQPPSLPSQYAFDAHGSAIFRQICAMAAYYLPVCEHAILTQHAAAIARRLDGAAVSIIDLGCGDGRKIEPILAHLLGQGVAVHYVAVDIDAEAVNRAVERAHACGVDRTTSIIGDFWRAFEAINQIAASSVCCALFLLGTTIGNVEEASAIRLLASLRDALRPGDHLVIGFDLLKPEPILTAAYDDALGLNEAFHMHLVERLRDDLRLAIEPSDFRFECALDAQTRAIESHLVCRRALTLDFGADHAGCHLPEGTRIRTELSRKFTDADIERLADGAGLQPVQRWFDQRRWFCDALFSVPRASR